MQVQYNSHDPGLRVSIQKDDEEESPRENITKGAKQKLNKLIINIHTGIGECIPKKATEVTENKKELVNM